MPLRRNGWRDRNRVLAVAATLICGTANAQETALTPAQMLDAANRLVLTQRPSPALGLAEALIARDPRDYSARLTASYAARDLGAFDQAETHAKVAWDVAQTGQQKFDAALAVAQAQASAGKRGRAQIWLRRAAQSAPNTQSRARAVRDYSYVRARNPWSYDLNIAIAPSDNLNNGTSTQIWSTGAFDIPVPAEMQALSGWSMTTAASVSRTVVEREDRRDRIGLQLVRRDVHLSDEAKTAAPSLRNSDFTYQQAEAFYERSQRFSFGELVGRASAGKSFYGGAPMADFGRVSLDWERARVNGIIGAQVSLEREYRRDNALRSANKHGLGLRWGERVGAGNLLATVDWKRTISDSVAVDNEKWAGRVQYTLAKPVLGAQLSVWAGLSQTSFDYSPYTNGTRRDLGREFGVSAFLAQHDYLGFAPEVAVTWDETRSDAVLYQRSETAISLRLRSTF